MTCNGPTSAHDARDPRRHVLPLNGTVATLCRGCVGRLAEMGMDWREDRRDPSEIGAYRRGRFGRVLRRAA